MATQTITQQVQTATADVAAKLMNEHNKEVPAWLQEFRNKGWTVVPQAISREKALEYADKGYEWLESWPLGFNRNNPSTHNAAHVPWHTRGGLYNRYGIAHEQFVWDLKQEPGLVEKFEQLYGTKELLVSYDGMNLSVPDKDRKRTAPPFWAHVDQSPLNNSFECVQGILNLLPNGPEDGGLLVLQGSSSYYTELWEKFDHKKGPKGWNSWAMQLVDEEMCQWLESKGCKWIKVCAQPGDLMLWDSRTIHYGAPPSSNNPRFAAYVCYKPVSLVPEESKKILRECWANKQCTTHDPSNPRTKERIPSEDHHSNEAAARRPIQDPVLSKRGRQLAGLDSY